MIPISTDVAVEGAGPQPRTPLAPTHALTRFAPGRLGRSWVGQLQSDEQRYGVRVANIGLLVPRGTIAEVIDGVAVYPMPNAQAWFTGLSNLRGNLIPVFDLRLLFEGVVASADRLLVVGKGDRAAAMAIGELPRPVSALHAVAQLPPLPEEVAPFIAGAHQDQDEIWLDVQFERFFEALGMRAGL